MSQSFGVYPALSMQAAYAPPLSEAAHDPERPCREAEAPVEGRLTWAFRSQVHDYGIMDTSFGGSSGSKVRALCMTWPGSGTRSNSHSVAARGSSHGHF